MFQLMLPMGLVANHLIASTVNEIETQFHCFTLLQKQIVFFLLG